MRRGINSYCAFGGQQIGAMWERPTSCCSESCTARKEEEMTSRANAAPTSNDLIKDRQRLDAARRQTERFWSWNWIFTHIRIKVILVFVLSVGHVEPRGGVTYRMSHKNGAETQNDPLTSRRNDLCLWVNVHTSSPAFWWTFLHQLVSFFCSISCGNVSISVKKSDFPICGYDPCVAAAPSFHFTADCSHCFLNCLRPLGTNSCILKYLEGRLPQEIYIFG